MCDYSLELYRSRPAQAGETYETHRFPSGAIGFVSPGDCLTAVCMAYDTRLKLSALPDSIQNTCGVGSEEEVTFVRLETGPYHDGVRFANGAQVTLQRLGTGVKGYVIDALASPPRLTPVLAEAL